ncbi:MAG TPA: sensor domain-containing protein [Solirubrobacterales bacterium]|nr:sensor domain-containing protein [Solirubrobacterales bacterium]
MSAFAKALGAEGEGVGERIAGLLSRAWLDLAYVVLGGLTAVVAFCVWVTAASVTISLLVFIVGLPVFLLSAIAFRWTAELDRRNAAVVRGEPLRGRYRDHRGESFLVRLRTTAGDEQTWKDFAWLVIHSVIGFGFGVAAVTAVVVTLSGAVLPLWYWSIPEGVDWIWRVDSLGLAFLATLSAIPLAALTVLLLRAMAIAQLWLATALLDGGEGTAEPAAIAAAALGGGASRWKLPEDEASLAIHAAVSGLLGLLMTAVWAATGGGYYWPVWVWLALLIPLSLHFGLREAVRFAPEKRWLAVQVVISLVVIGICVAVWALAGFGTFWPIWTILGMTVLTGLNLLARLVWQRVHGAQRERELSERVETLTKTRRGALDVQSAELRRIERDLHDGAQARLVALSMQLGRAEERLGDEPEAQALLRAARSEASAAIAELRDLARGIAPPVLADRGLPAAVEALGRRSPVPVAIEARLERRPPAVIETAAYFVVAEALTNVAKHAPEAAATVRIEGGEERLRVAVADDGPGGADVAAGSGLTGLRTRVAALDGELTVRSVPGEGTTVEAVLPCGS